jgi:uncharacterized protein YwgA
MYFANLLGWNAMDFKYHNYGPYSETLAAELENMRNNGWIEERPTETGHERILYRYYLSPKTRRIGTSLIGKVQDVDPKGEKLVSRTRGLVKQLDSFPSDDLEIMSTLMYLKMQNPSLSDEQLVEQTHELKPQFNKDRIARDRKIFNIMQNFLSPELRQVPGSPSNPTRAR